MATRLNKGEALIEGRSQRNARGALEAAKAAGFPASAVRTVMEGYVLPEKAAKEFDEALAAYEAEQAGETASATAATPDAPQGANDGNTADGAESAESTESQETQEIVAPAKTANKPEWVAFATTKGYDESEDLTKDQLIERYGSNE